MGTSRPLDSACPTSETMSVYRWRLIPGPRLPIKEPRSCAKTAKTDLFKMLTAKVTAAFLLLAIAHQVSGLPVASSSVLGAPVGCYGNEDATYDMPHRLGSWLTDSFKCFDHCFGLNFFFYATSKP